MANVAMSLRVLIIQTIDLFYTPFQRLIPIETFRYAATGGFNTMLDISLYFICYNFILDKQIIDLQKEKLKEGYQLQYDNSIKELEFICWPVYLTFRPFH